MNELTIDKEFHELIPPLSPEEYTGLEQKIINEGFNSVAYGCIAVWNNIIVDGHNRHEICTKHNIPYVTVEEVFDSRDDVKEWIIQNQLSKRNITLFQKGELTLLLKPLIAAKAKEKEYVRKTTSPNSEKSSKPTIDTDKELTKLSGMGHDTLWKVGQILKNATDEVKQDVRSGKMSIRKAHKSIPTEGRPKKERKPKKIKTKGINKIIEEMRNAESVHTEVNGREENPVVQMILHAVTCFMKEINETTLMSFYLGNLSQDERRSLLGRVEFAEKTLKELKQKIMEGD